MVVLTRAQARQQFGRRKVNLTSNPEVEFFRRKGLFYRRWKPPERGVEYKVEQLILPKQCRKTVLELAHDIPMAGHQGRARQDTAAGSIGRRYRYFRISRTFAKVAIHMYVRRLPNRG